MSDPGEMVMKGLLRVFILESLASAPKHGYALLKEMEDRFGREPNKNRVYPMLRRMMDDGLVTRELDGDDDARGKTLYALADAGHEELARYQRLPTAFRSTVRRIWGGDGPAPEAPAAPAENEASDTPEAPEPAAPAEPPAEADAPAQDGPAISLTPQPPDASPKPYPCPEARVGLQKNPVTGDLDLQLTGCPMGAYDYCPKCPVYRSIAGLRALVFGTQS